MKNKNDAKQQHKVKDVSSQAPVEASEPQIESSGKTEAVGNNDAVESCGIVDTAATTIERSSSADKSSHLSQDAASMPEPVNKMAAEKLPLSKLALLCLIFIILLAGVSGYGFYYLYNQTNSEQQSFTQLLSSHKDDMAATQRQLEQQQVQYQDQLSQLGEQVTLATTTQQESISMVQEKMLELAGRRPNDWLLAEANYLVKLAGRKLWQEKDINTASTLLTTADIRIAEMSDPSLISIRQALAADIASLQALPRDNSETLALKLDGLISQVDNLKLNMVELPEVSEGQDAQQLSDSADDWQQNLSRMWHSFSDGFITVRRRNGSVEPLMSPKQQWYLEENLKSKLMQTQLAVYRQQQGAYEHAIELSSRWIMQFYDRQDSTTEFMLSELDSLKNEEVSINYPQKLSSSNLIIDELLLRNIGYDNRADR